MSSTRPEPPPTPNAHPPVWDALIAEIECHHETPAAIAMLDDMRARDAVGRERYGTPLQPWNGRDALVDAYQEALDLAVYVKQAQLENGERGPNWGALERALTNAVRAAVTLKGLLMTRPGRAATEGL